MPTYHVNHSSPLTQQQRQSLATSITNLHCQAFNTPVFFVHVYFHPTNPSDGSYFLAGKPRLDNSNSIVAFVRTSAARTKASFDALAEKIEDAWDVVVRDEGEEQGDENGHGAAGEQQEAGAREDAKRLLKISFTPMLSIREGGMAAPEAGQEDAWLEQNLPHIREMSEKHNIDEFTELLEEMKRRQASRALSK